MPCPAVACAGISRSPASGRPAWLLAQHGSQLGLLGEDPGFLAVGIGQQVGEGGLDVVRDRAGGHPAGQVLGEQVRQARLVALGLGPVQDGDLRGLAPRVDGHERGVRRGFFRGGGKVRDRLLADDHGPDERVTDLAGLRPQFVQRAGEVMKPPSGAQRHQLDSDRAAGVGVDHDDALVLPRLPEVQLQRAAGVARRHAAAGDGLRPVNMA